MIDVRLATTDQEREDALAVRRTVFIEEQGVAAALEREGDDDADHFVAYDGDEPVGAARLRAVDDGVGKVERVAVLADRRDGGIGTQLMDAVEATARFRNMDELVLHAQLPVAAFYDALDYDRVGEEFEEAGIPHVEMRKTL